MEVMQVLHMNKGEGETSYAQNSTVQRNIMTLANSFIEEALAVLLCNNNYPESMGIADLGCSSGPNTLMLVSEVIGAIYAISRQMERPMPELRVSLNDLPGNDFNDIFVSLPAFYNKLKEEKLGSGFDQCFISGVPGSFYGRLFPRRSLHFVHSSSSLHWLSQVPPALDSKAGVTLNKGKIYISKTSPLSVLEAYLVQFQKDFSLFLRSRSEEMVSGGRMVLSFMGRRISEDPSNERSCHQWELLSHALMSMVSEGFVQEEKVDSFNAPYYAPCPEELESEIMKEGSFTVDCLKAFEVDWDGGSSSSHEAENCTKSETLTSGQRVAKTIRAVVESMLESHFGKEIMDELFRRYALLVDDYFSKTRPKYVNLVISITKKG
ncbi:hypothetical protein RJ640_021819 [Escallonia rubra]|uniref:Jasmonate O-methyltransferase n=2 Tax=Escallonia rubra TaxID=112253 RepID=A0AA88RR79_9ASTE|nr:hypothetical protein RJ640_021819 [Escallonia rubra]